MINSVKKVINIPKMTYYFYEDKVKAVNVNAKAWNVC